jgi:hypothetical protein
MINGSGGRGRDAGGGDAGGGDAGGSYVRERMWTFCSSPVAIMTANIDDPP